VKKEEIINVLVQLGTIFNAVASNDKWRDYNCGLTEIEWDSLQLMIKKEKQHNPWFTEKNIKSSMKGLAVLLEEAELKAFANNYSYTNQPKKIALIMAGNIPLVGFHDLICVLLSGNNAICKLSSQDSRIPLFVIRLLIEMDERLNEKIQLVVGPLKDFDAVIATGSNNTIAQFETYFRKYPHIFRRNRTSIAVLTGEESKDELTALGDDCFLYFGMGCRNVSKIFIPKDFNTDRLFEAFLQHSDLINHHKYGNNYDYNRTIFLMNSIPFLDNNCFMLKEDKGLHAPLSVIYYERYENLADAVTFIQTHRSELQVIVGKEHTPFGVAQTPKIDDFADDIDTMLWLNELVK
jgi:hypothetical protein